MAAFFTSSITNDSNTNYNVPVNLDNVTYITYVTPYKIVFTFNSGDTLTWQYNNPTDRDTDMLMLRAVQRCVSGGGGGGGGAVDSVNGLTGDVILTTDNIPEGSINLYDKNYLHIESVPSTSWTIVHNLGKFPSVTVTDSANQEVEGQVDHISINELILTFSAAFSGQAFLN